MTLENHTLNVFAIALDGKGGIKEQKAMTEEALSKEQVWLNLSGLQVSQQKKILQKYVVDEKLLAAFVFSQTQVKSLYSENSESFFLGFSCYSAKASFVYIKFIVSSEQLFMSSNFDLDSVTEIYDKLKSGEGVKDVVELFFVLCQGLMEKASELADNISEQIDSLEEKLIKSEKGKTFDKKIYQLRKATVSIHRYIVPQRDVFQELATDIPFLATSKYRNHFKIFSQTVANFIENIEYCREHIVAIKDELEHNTSLNIDHNMYVITLMISVFTPLSLLLDIVGVDMSVLFKQTEYAFYVICFLIGLLALIMFFILRRFKI
ncbi:MAG: CorA family divalent cation transporter [Alphaproteobacteria bacterium]|nr:CorA family divalent cation transporter [Alphaproteobacteria bacterium]